MEHPGRRSRTGPERRSRQDRRYLLRRIPLAIALCGLLLSLLVFGISYERESRLAQEEAQTAFVHEAMQRYTALQRQLAHSVEAVFALGRFFAASEVVGPAEFFSFTSPWLERHTTLVSLQWVAEVPPAQRGYFEQGVRDYFPEYSVTPLFGRQLGEVRIRGSGDLHYPIEYRNPPAEEGEPLGLDLANDPIRREALQRARRTGKISVSHRFPLGEGKGNGVYVVCPVNALEPPGGPVGQGPYRGFAVLTLHIREVIAQALEPRPQGFDVWIIDRTAPANAQLLYGPAVPRQAAEPEAGSHAGNGPDLERMYVEERLRVGDRSWAFVAIPSEEGYATNISSMPWFVLLGGLATTGMLFAYLSAQGRSARRIAESEERFRLIAENTRDLIATADQSGRIEYVSPAVSRTLGLESGEFLGRKAWRWVHREDVPRLKRSAGELVQFRARAQDRWRWLEGAMFPVSGSKRPYFVLTARDITGRVHQESRLRALNRTLRLLSRGNEAVLTAEEEGRLYRRICDEVVQTGGYRFAWVVLFDPATSAPSVHAHNGQLQEELVPCLSEALGGAAGQLPVPPRFTVLRDFDSLPCGEQLRANGSGSLLLLPLRDARGDLGLLGIAAARSGPVDEEESELLERLGANLAFGIRTLRDREALRLRQRVVEVSLSGVAIIDVSGPTHRIEYVNPAFRRITGFAPGQVVGQPTAIVFDDGEENAVPRRRLSRAVARGTSESVELQLRRPDGQPYWVDLQFAPVPTGQSRVTRYAAVFNDITEERRYRTELEHQAHHDEVTGLPNRNLLRDRLAQALARADRHGTMVAVLFLDIDQFKVVNDSLGHPMGDALLQELAPRLHPFCRGADTVARYGGDEFVMVADEISGKQSVVSLADRLRTVIAQPVQLGDHQLMVTCSIGGAIYPQHGVTADVLLSNADAAMYRAKERGRNRFEFFTPDLATRVKTRLTQEGLLRQALAREEFEVFYQPQVRLSDRRLAGFEALVRWRRGDRYVGPAEFMDLAEETGLVLPLGEWVLRTACEQAAQWARAGYSDLVMAVNLSVRQVEQGGIVALVEKTLQEIGLPPSALELELTESSIMREPERMAVILGQLKQIGVELAVDDFGTGYSSLAKLQRFPFDKLKIDKSFISSLESNPADANLSEAIIAMARALGLRVIAEGVESAGQMQFLRERGCDQAQGYFISRPVPAAHAQRFLFDHAGR